LLNRCTG